MVTRHWHVTTTFDNEKEAVDYADEQARQLIESIEEVLPEDQTASVTVGDHGMAAGILGDIE